MNKLHIFQILALFIIPLACIAEDAPEGTEDFKYVDSKDYRDRNPGFGQSWRFKSEYGWADEFVYNMGAAWEDGITAQLDGHVKGAIIKDFEYTEQQGSYRSFKILSTDEESVGGIKFVRMKLDIVHDDGKRIESYMYITAMNGELLKFRISLYTPVEAKAKKAMKDFLKARVAANKKKGASIPKGAFGFKFQKTSNSKIGAYYIFTSGENRIVEFFGGEAENLDDANIYIAADITHYSEEQDKGVYKTVELSKFEKTEICGMEFTEARLRIESPDGGQWTGVTIFATNTGGKVLKFMIFTPEPTDKKALKAATDFIELRIKDRAKG